MEYQVVIPKKAQKELEKIDNRYRQRILAVLSVLKSNPFVGKKLRGEYGGQYSYEVWPYRIIYEVYEHKRVVLIIRIGHRQGIY